MVDAGMWRHRLSVRQLVRPWGTPEIDHGHFREGTVGMMMMMMMMLVVMEQKEDSTGASRSLVTVTVSRKPERAWQGGSRFQG